MSHKPQTLTPGHSKAVLATYLTGSSAGMTRGLAVSIALTVTHVTMAVLIALFSLPLVSVMLGSAGSAPLLEDVSRGLLGVTEPGCSGARCFAPSPW